MTVHRVKQLCLVALTAFATGTAAAPASAEFRHGLSTFGELKYPPDFKHFDYVNPGAPKGGRFTLVGSGGVTSFDTFNSFILKGDAAQGIDLVYDSLMQGSGDEPSAAYGLIAESAEVTDDKRSVTFKLRPEAKFADGSPITADDVVFSFDILKTKGHPVYRIQMRDVIGAKAIDPHTVRYDFKGDLLRDLPMIVAGLPVLPKAWWSTRNFEASSLEKPLGSGPYAISDFQPGRYVTYKRRDDYWAKDLPVNLGSYNFDEIRYEYFRDREIALQNLLAGSFDYREEFTAKEWAVSYGVPAVRNGRIKRAQLPDNTPSGAQGFFLNLRRPQFQDPRVREAIGAAFDFEWSNRFLFFGLYTRVTSFFENSELKAVGPPAPEELALLEPYRNQLPPQVFTDPVVPPKSDGLGYNREQLKRASDLLDEAGWKFADPADSGCGFFCRFQNSMAMRRSAPVRLRRNAAGETLKAEILIFEDTFDRIIIPYVNNLRAIGIDANIRLVNGAQYQKRQKTFDFDIAIERYSTSLTPGIEIINFWGSETAKQEGSRNLAGIANPVIDELAKKVMAANSRAELVTTARAIDRVMRAGHYWVPQWYKASHNIAFWDKFAWPEVAPKYGMGVPSTWWYDPEKAAKLRSIKPKEMSSLRASDTAKPKD